jgi:uncharacterized protein (UPF0335 family)
MKAKVKNRMVPSFLYSLDVAYHSSGTMSLGNTKIFDFYKVDKLTSEQKQKIREQIPNVYLKSVGCQFAPEIVKACILVPKAAYYRLKKQGEKLEELF